MLTDHLFWLWCHFEQPLLRVVYITMLLLWEELDQVRS